MLISVVAEEAHTSARELDLRLFPVTHQDSDSPFYETALIDRRKSVEKAYSPINLLQENDCTTARCIGRVGDCHAHGRNRGQAIASAPAKACLESHDVRRGPFRGSQQPQTIADESRGMRRNAQHLL